MKRNSLTALLLCIVFFLTVLAGCGAEQTQPEATENEEPAPVAEDTVYITLYLTNEFEEIEAQSALAPEEGASGAGDEDLTTAMVTSVAKDALSAQTIVDQYNQLIIETAYGQQLVVNKVEEHGQTVKVDFDSDSVKSLDIEQGYEGQLFYNLARSIDDNLGDVDEIYFTMDGGKDFTLGHLWFEADRPFYSGIAPIEGEDGSSSEALPE